MPAPAYRSHTATQEVFPNISLDRPAGVANGDLLIASMAIHMNSNTVDISTVPTGWTLLRTVNNFANANQRLSVYWKIAASEPASWTWVTSISTGFSCVGSVIAISDPVDLGAGVYIADHSGAGESAASNSHPASSVTAVSADDMLVYFGSCRQSGLGTTSWTPPTGFTERFEIHETNTDHHLTASMKAAGAAGATGTVTATTPATAVKASVILAAAVGGTGAAPFVPKIAILG
jgi:hypothetical protein